MLLEEIAGARAEVRCLLPPGASPHNYDPRPSDARLVEKAGILVWGSPLLDAWAARMGGASRICLMSLVPSALRLPACGEKCVHDTDGSKREKHGEEEGDPHFWLDPLTVRQMLPKLAGELARRDPAGRGGYEKRAEDFALRLDRLHMDLEAQFAAVKGAKVVLFHPSFLYLLKRYGLEFCGAIEPFPGKEPTLRYLQETTRKIKAAGARAVFSEPQLPRRPAEALAEMTGLKVFVLDPVGGVEGRRTYEELLRYNARVLVEALRP